MKLASTATIRRSLKLMLFLTVKCSLFSMVHGFSKCKCLLLSTDHALSNVPYCSPKLMFFLAVFGHWKQWSPIFLLLSTCYTVTASVHTLYRYCSLHCYCFCPHVIPLLLLSTCYTLLLLSTSLSTSVSCWMDVLVTENSGSQVC